MLSIDTSTGAQSGTKAGATKGPGTIAATSSKDHPAVLGPSGLAVVIAGSPHDDGSLHCRHASKKSVVGSVHFAAEVVELTTQQTSSAITQADEQQQQQHLLNEYVGKDECQQQCKSSIQHSASSVGHQQSISSSRAANRTEHDRPTGPLKAKEAGPPIKADGNATSSTAAWRGSSTATEISAPIPRYIGSLIADLDPQLIKNHWNKQKRGFSFRSKGPGVTSEGSPRSSAAADVGSARVGKSIVKP